MRLSFRGKMLPDEDTLIACRVWQGSRLRLHPLPVRFGQAAGMPGSGMPLHELFVGSADTGI